MVQQKKCIHVHIHVRTLIFFVSSSSKFPMSKASAALTSPLGGMRGGSSCVCVCGCVCGEGGGGGGGGGGGRKMKGE